MREILPQGFWVPGSNFEKSLVKEIHEEIMKIVNTVMIINAIRIMMIGSYVG